jgi:DsbC/DsbD-like thiol-disulfide interchange protein
MLFHRLKENDNPMKINIGLLWLFLLIAGLFPLQGFANENKDRTEENQPHVKVEMIQEEETISPGRPFWVAIHLTIEPEWHVYWKNPGDAGIPVKVEWALPPGFNISPLEWPFPEKFSFEDLTGFGYENEVTLLAQLTPPQELQEGIAHPLKAKISWLFPAAVSFSRLPLFLAVSSYLVRPCHRPVFFEVGQGL